MNQSRCRRWCTQIPAVTDPGGHPTGAESCNTLYIDPGAKGDYHAGRSRMLQYGATWNQIKRNPGRPDMISEGGWILRSGPLKLKGKGLSRFACKHSIITSTFIRTAIPEAGLPPSVITMYKYRLRTEGCVVGGSVCQSRRYYSFALIEW